MGDRTRVFLNLGARVVAVEPQQECIPALASSVPGGLVVGDHRFTIVNQALGASEAQAALAVGSSDVLSSLSPDWIRAVRSSGRFSGASWSSTRIVPLTTLDRLIDAHGLPTFVKIDVRGLRARSSPRSLPTPAVDLLRIHPGVPIRGLRLPRATRHSRTVPLQLLHRRELPNGSRRVRTEQRDGQYPRPTHQRLQTLRRRVLSAHRRVCGPRRW